MHTTTVTVKPLTDGLQLGDGFFLFQPLTT